ncbi:unnamed protein product [Diplocarpon coronariae]
MQLKNIIVLALASAVAADTDDGPFDDIENFAEDARSIWNQATSRGSGYWSSVGAEASAIGASYSSEFSKFTATATPGPAASSYLASLESAAESAFSSLSSRVSKGETAAATTPPTAANTSSPTSSGASSKNTSPAGPANTSPPSSEAAGVFPAAAIGAMLFAGAAAFAMVL